jgi:hypothetical protein
MRRSVSAARPEKGLFQERIETGALRQLQLRSSFTRHRASEKSWTGGV